MASEYTPVYKLDLYTDNDKPNLRDQYNAAMQKIDNQMKVNANNVTTAIETGRQAKEASDISKTAAEKAQKTIDEVKAKVEKELPKNTTSTFGSAAYVDSTNTLDKNENVPTWKGTNDFLVKNALGNPDSTIAGIKKAGTSALLNTTNVINSTSTNEQVPTALAVNEIITNDRSAINQQIEALKTQTKDKFPVKTADISDGAITASKLAQTAINGIFSGLEVYCFNSNEGNASGFNNEGLNTSPLSEGTFSGFYLPQFQIVAFEIRGNVDLGVFINNTSNSKLIKLPNYVPTITKEIGPIGFGIEWNSENSFKEWTAIGMRGNGYIGVATAYSGEFVTMGYCLACLKPYSVTSYTTNSYRSAINANGLMSE